jgi:hypothetical protein
MQRPDGDRIVHEQLYSARVRVFALGRACPAPSVLAPDMRCCRDDCEQHPVRACEEKKWIRERCWMALVGYKQGTSQEELLHIFRSQLVSAIYSPSLFSVQSKTGKASKINQDREVEKNLGKIVRSKV